LSPICKDLKYRDGKNEMLNAVHCSDKLAGKFIRDILESDIAKDTILVVSSDHLAFKNDAHGQLGPDLNSRKNLLFIYNAGIKSSQVVSRPTSLLDVSPTILALLGSEQGKLGYGTNLLSPDETLNEKIGSTTKTNSFLLAQKQALIDALWKRPNLTEGIKINIENEKVILSGERWLKIPLIIVPEMSGDVSDIIFDHPNINQRDGYLGSRAKNLDSYIWIDDCDSIEQTTEGDIQGNSSSRQDWCISHKSKKDAVSNGFVLNEMHVLSSQWVGENVLGLSE